MKELEEYLAEAVSGKRKTVGIDGHQPASLKVSDVKEWLESIRIPFIRSGGVFNRVNWFPTGNGRCICVHFPQNVTGLQYDIQFVMFKDKSGENIDDGIYYDYENYETYGGRMDRMLSKISSSRETAARYFERIYNASQKWA